MAKQGLPAISLFSGALGLDLGLEQAGFTIKVAVECNRFAAATIRLNRPDIPVIEKKIEEISTDEILEKAGLKIGEPVLVTAGPSCQAFSTAGQRGSISDPKGGMFREFLRVVRETRAQFFIMENVRGVLSAAIKHRPLAKRGPGFPPLEPEEELGSALGQICKELKELGYYTIFDLLNAADFGVPQTRERVLFIGSRDGVLLRMPTPTHAKEPTRAKTGWVTLRRALAGLDDPEPAYKNLSPSKKKYLRKVPEGGNWRSLPRKLQAEALGGAYTSWGGRGGFFRRLAWDRPAPALTTRPDSKATMTCHPTELRPLSIRECIRLQQFDDDWQFAGGLPQQYLQLGNAVPVGLGHAVALAIKKALRRQANRRLRGKVICANQELLDRLAERPRTILNPIRMRKVKSPNAAKQWMNGQSSGRLKVLEAVDRHDEVQKGRRRNLNRIRLHKKT